MRLAIRRTRSFITNPDFTNMAAIGDSETLPDSKRGSASRMLEAEASLHLFNDFCGSQDQIRASIDQPLNRLAPSCSADLSDLKNGLILLD